MANVDVKAARKELAEIETRVAYLRQIIETASARSPKQLTCDIGELAAQIKNGTLEEELVVGDYIDFAIASGDVIRAYVVGKNHDNKTSGGKAEYTFACYIPDILFRMNETSDNGTSWKDSKMCNSYMKSFYNLLPSQLAMRLSTVNKKTSAGHDSSKILETKETVFLFSQIEIEGKTTYSKAGEGEQYEFFKDDENRKSLIKRYVWTRSPYRSRYFCIVYGDDSSYHCADSFCGVLFGFCL
ncbi:MAG: hypothetical protein IKA72_00545 [Clostridia bacterium]|nr:hypothetical protein [Clostridia bacterium]